MIYVVGSGPAGVSCAKALLQKEVSVTLLDAGLELESSRSDQLVKLQSLGSDRWQPTDLAFLKERISATFDGIPLKFAYGSDFPYRDPGVDWDLKLNDVDTRPSFAKGGLSTVWGAAVLPYRANDIRDWPIREEDLECHYRAVLSFMPLAGRHDLLEHHFPLYSESIQTLRLSAQGDHLLRDLCAASNQLKAEGLLYGASRLAFWPPSDSRHGCSYCGQCMYGCPFGVIYSSAHTLDTLREHPNLSYRKNVIVDRVAEHGQTVILVCHNPVTGERFELRGSRVFLACGALATTRILLESLEAFDEPLVLQDSAYFLLPLLRFRASPDVLGERLHTLAQVFLEIVDPSICEETIHLQIYTYNELFSLALKRTLGPAFHLFKLPLRTILNRLLIIQGYFPSSFSPSIRAMLQKSPTSNFGTLHLSPISNKYTASVLKKITDKLLRNLRPLQSIPLTPALRMGKPGRSFHSGGTFPMQASPGRFQSDRFGRPYGFSRVHAVDSTIFPSIPATTITLSVMANAHRIGSGLGDY